MLLGFGLAAFKVERDLVKKQARGQLTEAEVERLHAAIQATNYANHCRKKFVACGVVLKGQDLGELPSWRASAETSKMILKLAAHATKAALNLARIDVDRIDLTKANFEKNFRKMKPEDFIY